MNTNIAEYAKNGFGSMSFIKTDHAETGIKQNAPIAITGCLLFIKERIGNNEKYVYFEKRRWRVFILTVKPRRKEKGTDFGSGGNYCR
jgi:hypothetical protein